MRLATIFEWENQYRAFAFNADDETMNGDNAGNNLIRETDARGKGFVSRQFNVSIYANSSQI